MTFQLYERLYIHFLVCHILLQAIHSILSCSLNQSTLQSQAEWAVWSHRSGNEQLKFGHSIFKENKIDNVGEFFLKKI